MRVEMIAAGRPRRRNQQKNLAAKRDCPYALGRIVAHLEAAIPAKSAKRDDRCFFSQFFRCGFFLAPHP
jgi:hypothetical protein